MSDLKPPNGPSDAAATTSDPRAADPDAAEAHDPHSGVSDDPRVDPTPDRRHTEE